MTFVVGGLVSVTFAFAAALVGGKMFKKNESSQREDRFRLHDEDILNDDEYKQTKEIPINKL